MKELLEKYIKSQNNKDKDTVGILLFNEYNNKERQSMPDEAEIPYVPFDVACDYATKTAADYMKNTYGIDWFYDWHFWDPPIVSLNDAKEILKFMNKV